MRNGLIVLLAAGGLVAVAVVEGIRSNRWGAPADTEQAASKLANIPSTFGAWEGMDQPLDEKIVKVAEATGNVSRSYLNRKNGERVGVLILVGPTGPIGAHTPDICYAGLGYSCKSTPAKKSIAFQGGSTANFWNARFEKVSVDEKALIVYWAWSVNGIDWRAASNPRTEFALQSYLYKLYLVATESSDNLNRDSHQNPIVPFLDEFLPVLKTALSSAPG